MPKLQPKPAPGCPPSMLIAARSELDRLQRHHSRHRLWWCARRIRRRLRSSEPMPRRDVTRPVRSSVSQTWRQSLTATPATPAR